MANFFAKSKAEPSTPSTGHKGPVDVTDFEKAFKPFALKKGVQVAPINYFGAHRRTLDGVEELLGDEISLSPPPAPVIRSPPASLSGMINISLPYRMSTLNPP